MFSDSQRSFYATDSQFNLLPVGFLAHSETAPHFLVHGYREGTSCIFFANTSGVFSISLASGSVTLLFPHPSRGDITVAAEYNGTFTYIAQKRVVLLWNLVDDTMSPVAGSACTSACGHIDGNALSTASFVDIRQLTVSKTLQGDLSIDPNSVEDMDSFPATIFVLDGPWKIRMIRQGYVHTLPDARRSVPTHIFDMCIGFDGLSLFVVHDDYRGRRQTSTVDVLRFLKSIVNEDQPRASLFFRLSASYRSQYGEYSYSTILSQTDGVSTYDRIIGFTFPEKQLFIANVNNESNSFTGQLTNSITIYNKNAAALQLQGHAVDTRVFPAWNNSINVNTQPVEILEYFYHDYAQSHDRKVYPYGSQCFDNARDASIVLLTVNDVSTLTIYYLHTRHTVSTALPTWVSRGSTSPTSFTHARQDLTYVEEAQTMFFGLPNNGSQLHFMKPFDDPTNISFAFSMTTDVFGYSFPNDVETWNSVPVGCGSRFLLTMTPVHCLLSFNWRGILPSRGYSARVEVGNCTESGDSDGIGTQARFNRPRALVAAADGKTVYVGTLGLIRKINSRGMIVSTLYFTKHFNSRRPISVLAMHPMYDDLLVWMQQGDVAALSNISTGETFNILGGQFSVEDMPTTKIVPPVLRFNSTSYLSFRTLFFSRNGSCLVGAGPVAHLVWCGFSTLPQYIENRTDTEEAQLRFDESLAASQFNSTPPILSQNLSIALVDDRGSSSSRWAPLVVSPLDGTPVLFSKRDSSNTAEVVNVTSLVDETQQLYTQVGPDTLFPMGGQNILWRPSVSQPLRPFMLFTSFNEIGLFVTDPRNFTDYSSHLPSPPSGLLGRSCATGPNGTVIITSFFGNPRTVHLTTYATADATTGSSLNFSQHAEVGVRAGRRLPQLVVALDHRYVYFGTEDAPLVVMDSTTFHIRAVDTGSYDFKQALFFPFEIAMEETTDHSRLDLHMTEDTLLAVVNPPEDGAYLTKMVTNPILLRVVVDRASWSITSVVRILGVPSGTERCDNIPPATEFVNATYAEIPSFGNMWFDPTRESYFFFTVVGTFQLRGLGARRKGMLRESPFSNQTRGTHTVFANAEVVSSVLHRYGTEFLSIGHRDDSSSSFVATATMTGVSGVSSIFQSIPSQYGISHGVALAPSGLHALVTLPETHCLMSFSLVADTISVDTMSALLGSCPMDDSSSSSPSPPLNSAMRSLRYPLGIASERTKSNLVFVADSGHHCVKQLTLSTSPTGVPVLDDVTSIIGVCGTHGGVDGPNGTALLHNVTSVVVATDGNWLFVAEGFSGRIAKYDRGQGVLVTCTLPRYAIFPTLKEPPTTPSFGTSELIVIGTYTFVGSAKKDRVHSLLLIAAISIEGGIPTIFALDPRTDAVIFEHSISTNVKRITAFPTPDSGLQSDTELPSLPRGTLPVFVQTDSGYISLIQLQPKDGPYATPSTSPYAPPSFSSPQSLDLDDDIGVLNDRLFLQSVGLNRTSNMLSVRITHFATPTLLFGSQTMLSLHIAGSSGPQFKIAKVTPSYIKACNILITMHLTALSEFHILSKDWSRISEQRKLGFSAVVDTSTMDFKGGFVSSESPMSLPFKHSSQLVTAGTSFFYGSRGCIVEYDANTRYFSVAVGNCNVTEAVEHTSSSLSQDGFRVANNDNMLATITNQVSSLAVAQFPSQYNVTKRLTDRVLIWAEHGYLRKMEIVSNRDVVTTLYSPVFQTYSLSLPVGKFSSSVGSASFYGVTGVLFLSQRPVPNDVAVGYEMLDFHYLGSAHSPNSTSFDVISTLGDYTLQTFDYDPLSGSVYQLGLNISKCCYFGYGGVDEVEELYNRTTIADGDSVLTLPSELVDGSSWGDFADDTPSYTSQQSSPNGGLKLENNTDPWAASLKVDGLRYATHGGIFFAPTISAKSKKAKQNVMLFYFHPQQRLLSAFEGSIAADGALGPLSLVRSSMIAVTNTNYDYPSQIPNMEVIDAVLFPYSNTSNLIIASTTYHALIGIVDGFSDNSSHFTGGCVSERLQPGLRDAVCHKGPRLNNPTYLTINKTSQNIEPKRVVYFSDTGNNCVRIARQTAVSVWEIVTLTECTSNGGLVDASISESQLSHPLGLTLDGNDENLFVIDSGNGLLRRVDFVSNTVTTIARWARSGGWLSIFHSCSLQEQRVDDSNCALVLSDPRRQRLLRIVGMKKNLPTADPLFLEHPRVFRRVTAVTPSTLFFSALRNSKLSASSGTWFGSVPFPTASSQTPSLRTPTHSHTGLDTPTPTSSGQVSSSKTLTRSLSGGSTSTSATLSPTSSAAASPSLPLTPSLTQSVSLPLPPCVEGTTLWHIPSRENTIEIDAFEFLEQEENGWDITLGISTLNVTILPGIMNAEGTVVIPLMALSSDESLAAVANTSANVENTERTDSTDAFHTSFISIILVAGKKLHSTEGGSVDLYFDLANTRFLECAVYDQDEPTQSRFRVSVRFKPVTASIPKEAVQAAEISTIATGALSGVTAGTPTLAMYQARATLPLQLSSCKFRHDEPLEMLQSPTQFHFGEAKGAYYRGGVVANWLILVGCAAAMLLFVLCIMVYKRCAISFTAAMELARFPGILTVPFAVLLQGIVMCSIALAIHGGSTNDIVIAFFSLLVVVGLCGTVLYQVTAGFQCECIKIQEDAELGATAGTYLNSRFNIFFLGVLKWRNSEGATVDFKRRYSQLFVDYKGGYQFFIVLEIVYSILAGILEGCRPAKRPTCSATLILNFVMTLIFLILMLKLSPSGTQFNHFHAVVTLFATALSGCFFMIAQYYSNSEMLETAESLSVMVVYLGSTKMLADLYLLQQKIKMKLATGLSSLSERLLSKTDKDDAVNIVSSSPPRLEPIHLAVPIPSTEPIHEGQNKEPEPTKDEGSNEQHASSSDSLDLGLHDDPAEYIRTRTQEEERKRLKALEASAGRSKAAITVYGDEDLDNYGFGLRAARRASRVKTNKDTDELDVMALLDDLVGSPAANTVKPPVEGASQPVPTEATAEIDAILDADKEVDEAVDDDTATVPTSPILPAPASQFNLTNIDDHVAAEAMHSNNEQQLQPPPDQQLQESVESNTTFKSASPTETHSSRNDSSLVVADDAVSDDNNDRSFVDDEIDALLRVDDGDDHVTPIAVDETSHSSKHDTSRSSSSISTSSSSLYRIPEEELSLL